MGAMDPPSDWSDRVHDESRLLVPYLRKGVQLYGAEYVYAVLRSLQDAVELGRTSMIASDERIPVLDDVKKIIDQTVVSVERVGRHSAATAATPVKEP